MLYLAEALVFLSFVWVLFCVVSGGGPGILLIIDSGRPVLVLLSSVLIRSLWLLLQASDPPEFGL